MQTGLVSGQFFSQNGDQLVGIGGLLNVIVNAELNPFPHGLRTGEAGKYNRHAIRIELPHRTDNFKPVRFVVDIQIAEQQVELLLLYEVEPFGHSCGDGHFEPITAQNNRQGGTDIRLIINK